jgi:hypothetical protein
LPANARPRAAIQGPRRPSGAGRKQADQSWQRAAVDAGRFAQRLDLGRGPLSPPAHLGTTSTRARSRAARTRCFWVWVCGSITRASCLRTGWPTPSRTRNR